AGGEQAPGRAAGGRPGAPREVGARDVLRAPPRGGGVRRRVPGARFGRLGRGHREAARARGGGVGKRELRTARRETSLMDARATGRRKSKVEAGHAEWLARGAAVGGGARRRCRGRRLWGFARPGRRPEARVFVAG